VLPIVLTQKYRGDITIIPDVCATDYLRLLSNPTPNWIKEASLKAERKTWASTTLFLHVVNLTEIDQNPLETHSLISLFCLFVFSQQN
jgi:hypothetical protein